MCFKVRETSIWLDELWNDCIDTNEDQYVQEIEETTPQRRFDQWNMIWELERIAFGNDTNDK